MSKHGEIKDGGARHIRDVLKSIGLSEQQVREKKEQRDREKK